MIKAEIGKRGWISHRPVSSPAPLTNLSWLWLSEQKEGSERGGVPDGGDTLSWSTNGREEADLRGPWLGSELCGQNCKVIICLMAAATERVVPQHGVCVRVRAQVWARVGKHPCCARGPGQGQGLLTFASPTDVEIMLGAAISYTPVRFTDVVVTLNDAGRTPIKAMFNSGPSKVGKGRKEEACGPRGCQDSLRRRRLSGGATWPQSGHGNRLSGL